jgi:malate dehydrogenase (oxaloacetate-decarboxylating)(NADP+)
VVAQAYRDADLNFGPNYLIPKPFDPRLIVKIAPAVAQAAIDSGVATREIDMEAYVQSLNEFVYQSGIVMKPVFTRAKSVPSSRSACSTRRRERARAARRAGGGRRKPGAPDPHRPPGGDRHAHREARPQPQVRP